MERFGYIDSGRTYIIADPDEGWLFCVVNGKHWLARRVPDNEVAMVANTYTIRNVDLKDERNFLASKDIVEYAKSRGWYDPAADGSFDFAAVYANPKAASHPNNIGRQWSGLKCVTAEPLEPGPRLPFSVVPRQKLSVTDVMRILRHDKESEPDPSARTSPFICALCSGGTQTSFVAQLRKTAPADIGLVYWVCLASPRTSFYIPFHFGISGFPRRLASGVREADRRDLHAPGASSLRRELRRRRSGSTPTSAKRPMMPAPRWSRRTKAEAERLEREAVAMQPAIEEAARKLYETDKASAMRLLENYSKGIYLSSLESMNAMCAGE